MCQKVENSSCDFSMLQKIWDNKHQRSQKISKIKVFLRIKFPRISASEISWRIKYDASQELILENQ